MPPVTGVRLRTAGFKLLVLLRGLALRTLLATLPPWAAPAGRPDAWRLIGWRLIGWRLTAELRMEGPLLERGDAADLLGGRLKLLREPPPPFP